MSNMTNRVLSIQSHVVFGYVGNKSATFPLQLLGFEVDCINSCQLSNHTGYSTFKGRTLNEHDLDELMNGLSANNLDDSYTHLLTGYVRNISFLYSVVKVFKKLKENNSNLIYVCDPVLGDYGKLYVPKELVPVYRDVVIPLADIITPNQFELELLSEQKVNTIENALEAIDVLHTKGCKTVVVTSAEFQSSKNILTIIASYSNDTKKRAIIEVPKLEGTFTGTGDLFSALFLAWISKSNNDVNTALEHSVSTMQSILLKTLGYNEDCSGDNYTPKKLELKLIQSKNDIENPKILFRSKKM